MTAQALITSAYAAGFGALSERSLMECIVAASAAQAGGGVDRGTVDPTTAPAGGKGMYFNTTTGSLWVWDGSAWVALIK